MPVGALYVNAASKQVMVEVEVVEVTVVKTV